MVFSGFSLQPVQYLLFSVPSVPGPDECPSNPASDPLIQYLPGPAPTHAAETEDGRIEPLIPEEKLYTLS